MTYQSDRLSKHSTVFQRFRENSAGPAIELGLSPTTTTVLRREEILEKAERFSKALAEAGVEPGDRVVSLLPTSPEFLFTLFATWMRRAIIVPLPHSLPNPRIRTRVLAAIAKTRPRAVVTTPELAGAIGGDILPLSDGAPPPRLLIPSYPAGQVEVLEPEPSDIAYLQFTSGSTGEPKGAIIRHHQIVQHNEALASRMNPAGAESLRVVSWLPVHHDMGFLGGLIYSLCLSSGLRLIPTERFLRDPSCWLHAITQFRATVSPAPTFAFALLANRVPEARLKGLDLSSWSYANVGAEPVFWSTLEAFQKRFSRYGLSPTTLHPSYGLAEATLAVSLTDVQAPPRAVHIHQPTFRQSQTVKLVGSDEPEASPQVSNGPPLPGIELRVVNPRGELLGERREGRILIRGGFVSEGYFGEEPRPTDWLDTGDLGFLHEGEVYVTGRSKDILILGGQNIHPQELEATVGVLDKIRMGSVVAFATSCVKSGREKIVMVAETRCLPAVHAELRSAIAAQVVRETGIRVEDVFLTRPGALPKTTSGKIERKLCSSLLEQGKLAWDSAGDDAAAVNEPPT